MILPSCSKLNGEYVSFADADAIKAKQNSKGLSSDTRVSTTDGSSGEIGNMCPPELMKSFGVSDNNKCTKTRATEINKIPAKLFHHTALPFNVVESDELKDFIKASLCLAYH